MAEYAKAKTRCQKCGRVLDNTNFYSSNNIEKYPPEGIIPICKKCLTMHVDNWEPSTFLPILEQCDVPWIPYEWNTLLAKCVKNGQGESGTAVLGRYLAKMRLKQYRDYRWADTEVLQSIAQSETKQALAQEGYGAGEIAKAMMGVEPPPRPEASTPAHKPPTDDLDLTEEDKTYLAVKWGWNYEPREWVQLEKLYEEMMQSYDVQTAGHRDTLKLACKTSLKANQLLDIGDIDGAQKAVKMYDSLMRSGKFTAVQNKSENNDFVDSIGELVAMAESKGFIPRFYVDKPQDKVDRVLQDMQTYTRNLILEETNLSQLLENAIGQIEYDKAKLANSGADNASEDDILEAELFTPDDKTVLQEDKDEFEDFEENLTQQDAEATHNGP